MSEQEQGGPTTQHVVFTASITFIKGEDPMVVTRTTVDGQNAEVPFHLVLGADAAFQVGGIPQEPGIVAAYAQSLMKGSLSLAGRVLSAAKKLAGGGATSSSSPAPATNGSQPS